MFLCSMMGTLYWWDETHFSVETLVTTRFKLEGVLEQRVQSFQLCPMHVYTDHIQVCLPNANIILLHTDIQSFVVSLMEATTQKTWHRNKIETSFPQRVIIARNVSNTNC